MSNNDNPPWARFDFDEVVDRTKSASFKWDKYEARDIIPLWVADMDFRSPPAVVDALCERATHGVFGYTHVTPELERAVQNELSNQYGWHVGAEWIVWLPGLVSGLNVLCRSVGKPGDEVLTSTPIYPPFMSAPLLAGKRLLKAPLVRRGNRWEIDVPAFENLVTPSTKLLLLCSPHNPVGTVWSRQELTDIAEFALRHDLIIGSDEIHAGLVLDEDKRHVPIAALSAEVAARTVTLLSPSKTFNIPGIGCSCAVVSDPGLRRDFCRAMEGIVPHVGIFGYVATQAAYEKGGPWLTALLDYLRGNRDLLEQQVPAMPGLKIAHVEATYLAWIDVRLAQIERPGEFFEEAGVGLSDGCEFDAPGFVRLNFGCRRSLLVEALRRMREALESRRRACV